MEKDSTVLLIDEDSTAIDSIRRALGNQANRFKVRGVADIPTALARIWGGGIDLVLLNLPALGGTQENPLAPFQELQQKVKGVPVIVLCDSAAADLAQAAVQQGAAAYLLRPAVEHDLLSLLDSVAGKTGHSAFAHANPPNRDGGKIIAFMGAKGGVGTTTVALNVAAALA